MIPFISNISASQRRATILLTLTWTILFAPRSQAAPEAFKPILPLPLTWTSVSVEANLKNNQNLFPNKSANDKTVIAFKEALGKLGKKLSPDAQAKEINALRYAASKLGMRAKLVADLVAAQATSGLNSSGVKVGPPTGGWRGFLLGACNTASKIDEATHEKTATFAVTLWRHVEGSAASWSAPPIDAKAQRQFKLSQAIIERQALDQWAKGDTTSAFKKYRSMALTATGTPVGGALDLRTLELERSVYNSQPQASKQVQRWQKALVEMTKKYDDQHVLGDGNEAKVALLATTIAGMHRNLIKSLIASAAPVKASDATRNQTLESIALYLDTNIPAQEKLQIRGSKGGIEFNGGRHKASSATFSELAGESTGNSALGYWRLAIRSQTILAAWPVEVPWNGVAKGDLAQREALLEMYKKFEGSTAFDWTIVGHVGLLLINNSRTDEAFKLWTDRLDKFPNGVSPSHAAGLMAASYTADKKWSELEALGRMMTKLKITGLHLKSTFRPHDVLGLALLEGGLEAIAANDFKKSIVKLNEYVNGWAADTRHHEGLYHLAVAYEGDKQYRTSILTLEKFANKYPSSKWLSSALINGGNLSMGLAWDEHVIFFLEYQMKVFRHDEKTTASEQTLADLYMGRGIYDSAIKIMSIQLENSGVPQDTRIDIARRMIDTAERYGTPQGAIKLSDKLRSIFKNDPLVAATTLSLKARLMASKGRLPELAAIDKQASGMDVTLPQVADAVSEIKFLMAQTLAKGKFSEEVVSFTSKNPKGELESGYALYVKITNAYKAACLSVRSSWCGPALHRSAVVGDLFVTAYADLTIPETLDPGIVKAFQTRKNSILDTVNNSSLEADQKSVEQARLGSTNPDWTSTILLESGRDASAESFTRETANHFIQWHAK